MRRGALAPALLLLALLAAGCGGGGTTTVIERTVTVESGGEEATGGSGGDEAAAAEAAKGGAAEEEAAEESAEEEAAAGEAKAEEVSKKKVEAEEAAAGEVEEAAGQPEEKVEAPTVVVHLQAFRSPSGNIGCAMFEGGARCDIRKREWSPPARPASCPDEVDFGQGLTVSHDGKASFVCAGDTALLPSGTALGYGEASELGGTTCQSRPSGITCANHSGHGFFISTESYKTF